MTLGELKIASLMLTVPSLEISFDSDSCEGIEEKIMELKANPSVIDYVSGLVFSINRAFSLIEARGLTKTKRKEIGFENARKSARGYELDINKIGPDVLKVLCVYQKESCGFYKEGNTLVFKSLKSEPLEVVYKERLERIKEATSDLCEMNIDEGILEIVPYYIKSELVLSEDPEESELCRAHFFNLLKENQNQENINGELFVDTVYRVL